MITKLYFIVLFVHWSVFMFNKIINLNDYITSITSIDILYSIRFFLMKKYNNDIQYIK